MQKQRLVLLVCIGMFAALASGGQGKPSVADQQLRSVINQMNLACNSRNADAFVGFFAADVFVLSPQSAEPAIGTEPNREAWKRFFKMAGSSHEMTVNKTIVSRSRDMAYVVGHWTVAFPAPNESMGAVGDYVAVFRKIGKDWKISALSAHRSR